MVVLECGLAKPGKLSGAGTCESVAFLTIVGHRGRSRLDLIAILLVRREDDPRTPAGGFFMTPDPSTLSQDFGEVHFGGAQLGDRRRTKRLVDSANRIVQRPDQTLPHKLQTPAALDAFYRLMNEDDVTHEVVLAPHRQRTLERCRLLPGGVLMIHDSTELDYTSITSLTTLSQIGNGSRRGYVCHNSLAVDAQEGEVLGLANQILHHRRRVPKGETPKQRQQCQDRESRLWADAAKAIGALPTATAATHWIHIADRGGDTFEALEAFHQHGGFVVRSHNSRSVQPGHELRVGAAARALTVKLHDYARTLLVQATKSVEVHYRPADRKGRTRRPAQPQRLTEVGIAWAPVRLDPPQRRRGQHGDEPIHAWIVHVRETQAPKEGEPLEWFLLTDQPVTTAADALQVVDWYERRWIIEEYHKVMKTGCRVESVQFTTEEALQPTIALLSVVSVFLLTLRDLARRPDAAQRPAAQVIDSLTIEVLGQWRQGKPWQTWSVVDFVLALGRLGGHQNRKGDGLPGWLTLWRGWQELQAMLTGARLARKQKRCG